MVKVKRYVWQRHHRRWHCHGTTTYLEGGGKRRTFSRSFVCGECKESLHDGDQGYDTERGFVHENCYTGEAQSG